MSIPSVETILKNARIHNSNELQQTFAQLETEIGRDIRVRCVYVPDDWLERHALTANELSIKGYITKYVREYYAEDCKTDRFYLCIK